MRGIDELDHYELLEIHRGAMQPEIDRAYRTAQQTYADGSLALYSVFERTDAAAIRERLDEAYRVLSDPELREVYDEELGDPVEKRLAGRDGVAAAASTALETDAAESIPADGIRFESLEQAVEEYETFDDDGRGEFDGVRLRRNRLFRGYELEDISDVTKVSCAHLRNIEEENFIDLPADVYVRGFVTAYAQTIGLDPKQVVPSYMARVQDARAATGRSGFLGRR